MPRTKSKYHINKGKNFELPSPLGLDYVFTFGQHRKETLREVIDTNGSHIKWCMSHIPGFILDEGAREYLKLNGSNL